MLIKYRLARPIKWLNCSIHQSRALASKKYKRWTLARIRLRTYWTSSTSKKLRTATRLKMRFFVTHYQTASRAMEDLSLSQPSQDSRETARLKRSSKKRPLQSLITRNDHSMTQGLKVVSAKEGVDIKTNCPVGSYSWLSRKTLVYLKMRDSQKATICEKMQPQKANY